MDVQGAVPDQGRAGAEGHGAEPGGPFVQARRDIAPVLLLDEVIAHLDAARREALFDRLLSLHGQIWMTGTEAEPFASLSKHHAQFIEIGVA